MKKVCIVLNSILVVLIVLAITYQPNKNKNVSVNAMSKSLTTSAFNSIVVEDKKEEVVVEEENKDMEETVDDFEEEISNNVVEADIVSDVLETQVGTMSAYGLDCAGCSGGVGASYDAGSNNVRYYDPVYGECRIIAADPKYPYGTIMRVSNSNIGTFNAIVLDRGGNIGIGRRFMADLLFHTEAEASNFGLSRNVTFEVLRYGY